MRENSFEYGIVGGGLAGLSLAIRLGKAGIKTAVFERKEYPHHKVCGEYVSLETLPYLKKLGFDPFEYGAVKISRLQVSGTDGKLLNADLDLGGFGLSRYTFDLEMSKLAEKNGVVIYDKTQIQNLKREGKSWILESQDHRIFQATKVIGAQGKRSNLDAFLKRDFLKKRSPYVGIKYHIRYNQDDDLIALHNFQKGYCGISRIENDKYCLCYLASANDLKSKGSIQALEKELLMKNPFLSDIFRNAEFEFDKPMAINEITFSSKKVDENGIPMIGDAAGMIAPLCGNGMAMAIHSSKILADSILEAKKKVRKIYAKNWKNNFSTRLRIGRAIQKTFGNNRVTNLTLSFFNLFPTLKNYLIAKTHGKEF